MGSRKTIRLRNRASSAMVSFPRLFAGAAVATGLGLGGTIAADALGLALLGVVLGLLGLALLISFAPDSVPGTGYLFDRMLPHMVLLFVPAGSGVVSKAFTLAGDWVVVVVVVLFSTPAVIAIVTVTAQALFATSSEKEIP